MKTAYIIQKNNPDREPAFCIFIFRSAPPGLSASLRRTALRRVRPYPSKLGYGSHPPGPSVPPVQSASLLRTALPRFGRVQDHLASTLTFVGRRVRPYPSKLGYGSHSPSRLRPHRFRRSGFGPPVRLAGRRSFRPQFLRCGHRRQWRRWSSVQKVR